MNEKVKAFVGKNQRILDDIFVYDSNEVSNTEAFRRLPSFYQEYITAKHVTLRNYVFSSLKNSDYKPVFTSGFRSYSVNKYYKGVEDSLHLHGLAVDFILLDKFDNIVSTTLYNDIKQKYFISNNDFSKDFTLIVENSHFHLQYKRG